MADKYHSDTQEKIMSYGYSPGYQTSDDLEAGTKTVTATSKPGTPDYTTSLTVPAPPDNRILLKRVGVRIQLTIDSMTAGHLYGSIHVNGVERKTLDLTTTGDHFIVFDLTEGQFNVGNANDYEIYLWVDTGDAVASVCQIWQAVGTTDVDAYVKSSIQIMHKGFLHTIGEAHRIGTGNIIFYILPPERVADTKWVYFANANTYLRFTPNPVLWYDNYIVAKPNNGGDLAYFTKIWIVLRSEQ